MDVGLFQPQVFCLIGENLATVGSFPVLSTLEGDPACILPACRNRRRKPVAVRVRIPIVRR